MSSKREVIQRHLVIDGMKMLVSTELKDDEIHANIEVEDIPHRYVASTPEKLRDNVLKVRPMMLCDVSTKDIERVALAVMECAEDLVRVRRGKGEGQTMDTRIDNLIRAAYERRDEIVLCLLGAPGIGKTEAVERFARERGVNVTHLILSQVMPNEISGITMPVPESHSMSVFDNDRLASMKDGDILFLDEVLKAQQPVLSACLTLIQERRMMSGRKLADVMIIAAANPLPSAATLPLEIRQRFMFVKVEFIEEEWLDYMKREHGVRMDDIVLYLDVTGDGLNWNSPTPRTATKMVEWMKSVYDDTILLSSVKEYCRSEFGEKFEKTISKAVSASMEEDRLYALAGLIDEVNGYVDDEKNELTLRELRRHLSKTIKSMGEEELDKLMELAKDFDMSCFDNREESDDVEG